ncbi:hypothetical protein Acr_23g0006350 [Actinidia rufa]|uniref:CCHC-type domain-containing protein n=1 Tax=Actinidia rufa TaxID=165716 RepID=A0A7J0GN77_9ERIC|nr:hypothetical protein Acr_23g0006350 [Actinidia rufa]
MRRVLMDQAGDDVSGEDILEQNLIDEKVSEFEVSEWDFNGRAYYNSAPNGKLTMSKVSEAIFNEKTQMKEMDTTDRSESHALVSEGSNKDRGFGQLRDTSRGRPRSKLRGHTLTCFHCNQEGHIKRNCTKLKTVCGKDQSSETAATTVITGCACKVMFFGRHHGGEMQALLDGSAKMRARLLLWGSWIGGIELPSIGLKGGLLSPTEGPDLVQLGYLRSCAVVF